MAREQLAFVEHLKQDLKKQPGVDRKFQAIVFEKGFHGWLACECVVVVLSMATDLIQQQYLSRLLTKIAVGRTMLLSALFEKRRAQLESLRQVLLVMCIPDSIIHPSIPCVLRS